MPSLAGLQLRLLRRLLLEPCQIGCSTVVLSKKSGFSVERSRKTEEEPKTGSLRLLHVACHVCTRGLFVRSASSWRSTSTSSCCISSTELETAVVGGGSPSSGRRGWQKEATRRRRGHGRHLESERLLEAYWQGAWQRWINGAGGWIRRREDGRKKKKRKEIERREKNIRVIGYFIILNNWRNYFTKCFANQTVREKNLSTRKAEAGVVLAAARAVPNML